MDTKYIFLDIDGTLVGRDAVIPDSAREAINQARANGHKVFICSGRSRCEMHEDILSVPLDGIVGSAGAYVELEGRMIYHRPMTEKMNARLLDYFESKKMAVFLETNEDLLVNDIGFDYMNQYIAYCKSRNEPYDKALFEMAKRLSEISEPAKLPVNKMLYVTMEYDPEDIRRDLQDEFTVVDSAIALPGNSGELSELGMHKGNGINFAGIAIAMGNANPILKDIADFVTTDVDEDGIKNAFLHYGLI